MRNCYTKAELETLSAGRYFDQIIVAVDNLKEKQSNIRQIYHVEKWTESGNISNIYHGICSSAWMNDVELKLIEPDDSPSPWRSFFQQYGSGICCVRENCSAERYASEQKRYRDIGVSAMEQFEDNTGKTTVYDLRDKLGGFFAIHCDCRDRAYPAQEERNPRKLCQINITTDDVNRTCADVAQLLQIGPYAIGTLDNQTVTNGGLLAGGKWCCPEFSFQLGMALSGNLEFEVIQPSAGPTVYQSYIDRRGVGYHHIKEIIPADRQEQIFREYIDSGMPLCIKGTLDITTFAYLNSEQQFGFYVELGDGIPPRQLPEGYNLYEYPAK